MPGTMLLFAGLFDWVGEFVRDMSREFLCQLKRFACWLADFVFDLVIDAATWATDYLPEVEITSEQVSYFLGFIDYVNQWVPLTYALTTLGVVMIFDMFFVAVKLVIKFVPFVG